MSAYGGARREAGFGTLMSRSVENLWTIRTEVAIYLVVVAVCVFTLPLLGLSTATCELLGPEDTKIAAVFG